MLVSIIQSPTQQGHGQNIKILIIDDQQLFIDSLVYVLKTLSDDVEIQQANSIDEAITKLINCDNYDLMLLDMNMPGMGGLDVLHHINSNDCFIPTVVISTEQEAEKIQLALELGAMGFIPKSYQAEQMKSAIRTILEGNMYLPDELQKQLNNLSLQAE